MLYERGDPWLSLRQMHKLFGRDSTTLRSVFWLASRRDAPVKGGVEVTLVFSYVLRVSACVHACFKSIAGIAHLDRV